MLNRQVMTALKNQVVERAQGTCEYCRSQARFATQAFSIEHITPQSKGGETALDNLALACQGCNNHKYNKTESVDPITGESVNAIKLRAFAVVCPYQTPRHDGVVGANLRVRPGLTKVALERVYPCTIPGNKNGKHTSVGMKILRSLLASQKLDVRL